MGGWVSKQGEQTSSGGIDTWFRLTLEIEETQEMHFLG